MKAGTLSILGCGWLGMAVADRFLREGWQVNGSTTTQEKLSTLTTKGVNAFLVEMNPHLQGSALDRFFHADVLLVSVPPRRKAGLTDLYNTQIESLSIALTKTNITRIIFISSTSIYDDLNREVFEEDANPSSYLYRAEQCLFSVENYKTTVLRFAGLIGGDRHPGRFLSGKQNVDGAEMPVNMIHQQDCVNIIMAIVQQDLFGDVFNACADLHPTKKEFYEASSRALNVAPPTFSNNVHTPFKIVNADKLKEKLQYQFTYPDPMSMI
ncbi:SDR family oxidoreductase [Pseudochryseolinea flava]|nr:SDR family oxidoreductase [Pseudochryseolinea flava]